MEKAISELVIGITILAIAVALIGVSYIFMSNFQGESAGEIRETGTQSIKKLGSCLKIVSFDDAKNYLWVKNCGRYPAGNITLIVDNAPAYTNSMLTINPNEIGAIVVYGSAGQHSVKIVGDYASAIANLTVTNPITFDFSISLNPASGSVIQGSGATTAVTASLIYGTLQSVSLSCSGLPSGTSCSFDPSSIIPTASSTLAISTSGSTPPGNYFINIGGAGGNMTRNVTYSLTVQPDLTPPATITDLSTSNPTANSVKITWTTPGDDGNVGTASQYDIRYSTSPITEENWASAAQVTGEPSPLPPGQTQWMTVTGLSPGTTYYFAMKTADEVPNWSGISNSPSGTTRDSMIIFVSSAMYNGNMGGLAGADARCQALADAANLNGTFKAWLSSSAVSAKDRLTHSLIPYKMVDGTVVANDWNDLVDGSLQKIINKGEDGVTYSAYSPMTNTNSDGTKSSNSCNDWTSSSNLLYAHTGNTYFADSRWTAYDYFACFNTLKMYCIEQ